MGKKQFEISYIKYDDSKKSYYYKSSADLAYMVRYKKGVMKVYDCPEYDRIEIKITGNNYKKEIALAKIDSDSFYICNESIMNHELSDIGDIDRGNVKIFLDYIAECILYEEISEMLNSIFNNHIPFDTIMDIIDKAIKNKMHCITEKSVNDYFSKKNKEEA